MAVRAAQVAGARRILLVDYDVHSGLGTQVHACVYVCVFGRALVHVCVCFCLCLLAHLHSLGLLWLYPPSLTTTLPLTS